MSRERAHATADARVETSLRPLPAFEGAEAGNGTTPSVQWSRSKPPALDFFAGGGLASESLRSSFSIVWANDICEKKAATYSANHPAEKLRVSSIEDVRGQDLPYAALSWASFPCQDLSLAGNLHGIESSRSGLVWEWLRVMDEMEFRPKVVVAENVVGLVSASQGKHYLALHTALSDRGYRVGAVVLDAARWVPQSRVRVFVVGVASKDIPNALVSEGPTWCQNTAVVRVAKQAPDFVWWTLREPRRKPRALEQIVDFQVPTHAESQSKRNLGLIPPHHRSRMDAELNCQASVFPGYKRTRGGKQVLELRFDNRAGCLRTPQGGSSRQYFVLCKDGGRCTRLVTVREAARLMGVRDSYKVIGSYNEGYKAMGDGVAVPVVRHLARQLLLPLAEL